VDVLKGIRNLVRKSGARRQPIDTNEIIRWSMNSLRGKFNEMGVEVRDELASGLPLVDGDRSQLQGVLLNLIHNALEAMAGAQNHDRLLMLRTGVSGSDTIVVAIEDTGPGIDPKNLDAIFDPFISTKKQGMGLGLAICRSIVEGHGGRLTASSDGTTGATFKITLPINASASIQVPGTREATGPADARTEIACEPSRG
jgi:C4-dicarboxylate-specific signal transduction histidine kinase